MHVECPVRIFYIERLDGGVIIGFNDGTCAIYSATLLHSVLDQAVLVPLVDEDEDEYGV